MNEPQSAVRLGLVILALLASPARAQVAEECVAEVDATHRLACYDRLFRAARGVSAEGLPMANMAPDIPSPASAAAMTPPGTASEKSESSALMKFWELTADDKRGTFIVRTYQPNFVLPLHVTSSINRQPGSPTQPTSASKIHYRTAETKLQLSLRAKIAEDFLLPEADLWFAYTQRALWQTLNRQDSSPLRSTDHQPEMIYVVPVPPRWNALLGNWKWRMVELGLAHQSNGQSDPLSRSWHRVYAGTALEHGEFSLQVRTNYRLPESGLDNNPDLTEHIGNTELTASWLPGRSTASLTWRNSLKSLRRGSLQFDLTYPVNIAKPEGLRWYLQVFSGYGETLLDYNHRQTSIGAGLSLFQF